MRIAFVGTGYVADLYAQTLRNHPELELTGVFDRFSVRRKEFAAYHGFSEYPSLADLLVDPAVEIVVNLTGPAQHGAVTRAALEAGKHVYTEKPIALDLAEARGLAELAAARGLQLASAPASMIGEAAQSAWQALRAGAVGRPLLAYAELDDGYLLAERFREWSSESGAPWPYPDEFRTGCTIEHAAYALDWLTMFFGPVTELVAYSDSLLCNPYLDEADRRSAADFSLACLRFGAAGVVARVTTSIIAPEDHSMRIVGDEGVITVENVWDYTSPVTVKRGRKGSTIAYPSARPAARVLRRIGANHMDFARGIAELAAGIRGERHSRLQIDHALHVLELTLRIARAGRGLSTLVTSTFAPIEPMPWAAGDAPCPWLPDSRRSGHPCRGSG